MTDFKGTVGRPAPFAYTGRLHDVTVQLPDGRDPDADEVIAAREWSRQ